MAEDNNLGDILHTAEVHRSDSNRRYLSPPLPYSCQIGQTNNLVNPNNDKNSSPHKSTSADVTTEELNKSFSELHCKTTRDLENTIKVISNVANKSDFNTGKQWHSPLALPSTSHENHDTISQLLAVNYQPNKPMKRKRDSPQTRNVREKLLQYAYKDKSAKNVTFVLQADEDATTPVEMEEGVSNSASTTSIRVMPIQERSNTNLGSAVQHRSSRSNVRHPQHSDGVQTLPTEDEMRSYQVPESKAPIWKLYEQKLRTVGRSQARIQQLTSEIEEGNPPSWCFGGTQAPQYMRPFHHELVSTTLEYAMKMAITARNLLIREAEQDAGQARHLQETLSRMYKQDKDPNFELATGRAEGIAAHYSRKETALNIRLSEDDQVNIPDTVEEWAELLCRRKVSKTTTRSRS